MSDPTPPAATSKAWDEFIQELGELQHQAMGQGVGPRRDLVKVAELLMGATREAADPETNDALVLKLAAIIRELPDNSHELAEAILHHPNWPALLPSPTREAGPLPQAGAEITRDQATRLCSEVMAAHDRQTFAEVVEHFARAVLARWGGAAVQPVPELPPRPPMVSAVVDRHDLVRYGVTWDGRRDQPLLTPRPDGYWTPWHIAAQLPQPGAGAMRELRELVEAMHDAFFGNDTGLPPRVIQAVNSANLFLTVHPSPAPPP
jgi:hypothetical protein